MVFSYCQREAVKYMPSVYDIFDENMNKSIILKVWIRSGGAVVSTVGAKSSGFRSFSENTDRCAWSLSLCLSSCCAVPGMQCWQWEGQRSGIRFITGGWLLRGDLQEERWVWGHVRGGPDSNSFCLEIWSEGFSSYFLSFLFSKLISFHIVLSRLAIGMNSS